MPVRPAENKVIKLIPQPFQKGKKKRQVELAGWSQLSSAVLGSEDQTLPPAAATRLHMLEMIRSIVPFRKLIITCNLNTRGK